MKKSLTEQWKDGELPDKTYYWKKEKDIWIARGYEMQDYLDVYDNINIECLAPVPSYNKVKEMSQKIERLEFDNEALEMVHNELVQKIHILNEQNTKQYNELCEEIKKNNTLEKQLDIATKALREYANCKPTEWMTCVTADKALKEMEGVK